MNLILRFSGAEGCDLDYMILDIDAERVRGWIDIDTKVNVAFNVLLQDDRIGKPFYVSYNFVVGEFCGCELTDALPPEITTELEDGIYALSDDIDLDELSIEVARGRADCPQMKFYGDGDVGVIAYDHHSGAEVSCGPFSLKELLSAIEEG